MIFSTIEASVEGKGYPTAILKGLEYLRTTDFSKIEDGVYEIEGRDIYAQVFHKETQKIENTRAETHKEYLDVQFLIEGEELIGFTNLKGSYIVDEYIKDRDLIFYKDVKDDNFVKMVPGSFCVLFTDDVHRPAIAVKEPMNIRKVVMKISTKLLK